VHRSPEVTTVVRHFTDLTVWQASHRLFLSVAEDVDRYPRRAAARVLADQTLRSSAAIGANIAEGFNARSTREYLRFIDIALRTTHETENWLLNLRALAFVTPERAGALLECCTQICRMLSGLKTSLKRRSLSSTSRTGH
jgi:four helix bundle protein